jgi:glycine/D-amino acid oxidase-like deaminating enzyme
LARHVAVIGSGIIGASIAWHLVRAGARVTVIEAGDAGGLATPCSFAWINASWGNPLAYFRLRVRAMAEWRRLAAELPGLPLNWCGGLCFDMAVPALEAYAREHGAWGYGIRRVGRAEAARIEPNLAEPPEVALHVAEEGTVEPRAAALALLADARRKGAEVRQNMAVTALAADGERVTGVATPDGPLEADHVVVAAGAGTPALLRTVGLDLPMTTPPGLLIHSRPHAPLLNGLVLGPEAHLRQTDEGCVVAGADFAGDDPGPDPEGTAQALFQRVKAMLKGANNLGYGHHSVGYRPTPADGFPAVGTAPGRAGLSVAVMHSGITLAAAVGLFTARDVLEGSVEPLLAPFAAARLLRPA